MKIFTLLNAFIHRSHALLVVLFLIGTLSLQAQAPKVAFVGITRTGSLDGFSFVAGEDITGSEVIYFTDEEYRTACGAFHFDNECEVIDDGEPYVTYTAPVDGLSAGEVVFISETSTNMLTVTGGGGTAVLEGNGGFSISGSDKYHAFATSNPSDPLDNVTEVYAAISLGDPFDGTVLLGDDPRDDYPNAVVTLLGDVSDAEYNPSLRGNPADAMAIMDLANWNIENPPANLALSTVPFTGGIDLSSGCTPVINGVTAITCPDTPTGFLTFGVDGELNGADSWYVELVQVGEACGNFTGQGGISFTESITLGFTFPDAEYVVYAVGDCVTEQVCFSFTPNGVFGIPSFSLTTTTYNELDGIQTGLGGATPVGGVYSGPGVTDDGNGMTFSFDPAAAGVGVHNVTYTTGSNGACSNLSTSVSVTVVAPSITFPALGTVCEGSGIQTITGGATPVGGVYSGTGVTDGGNGTTFSFDPSITGVGSTSVNYSLGSSNASSTLTVAALPTVTFTSSLSTVSADAGLQTGVSGGSPGGGVYSGNGVTDDGNGTTFSFDPATAGIGENVITYTYTDGNGCTSSQGAIITVTPAVALTLSLSSICNNAGTQTGLGGGTPTGGVYSGAGVTDDGNGTSFSFDPAASGTGEISIFYTIGTSAAFSIITVNASPTVTFASSLSTISVDAGLQTSLSGGSPTGGVYSGPGVTDDGNGMSFSFDPAAAGTGEVIVTYTFADGNGCSDNQSDVITVEDAQLPGDICPDAIDIDFLFDGPLNEAVVSTVQDNTGYDAENDPGAGYECWFGDAPVLNNTIWYAFTGDGEKYGIRSIQCDSINPMPNTDTQFALYSGDCTTPTAVACNDDEDFDNQVYNSYMEIVTEPGVDYLLMVDGYVAAADYAAIGTFCLEVTLLESVGVTDLANTDLKVYPNPTNGEVQLPQLDMERVEVYNATGQLVLNRTTVESTIDLGAQPAGLYLLKIYADGVVYSTKVVKQ